MRLTETGYFLRRAVLVAALLSSTASRAAEPPKSRETHKDLIAKAESLSLQRDRVKAAQVLVHGLQKEKKGSPAWKELNQSLWDLAGLFYADKTQKLFELAESLYFSGAPTAAAKYQEALTLEPDNLTILLATARARMAQGQCADGLELAQKAAEIHPFSDQVGIHIISALTCTGAIEEARKTADAWEMGASSQKLYLYVLQAQWELKGSNPTGAETSLQRALEVDPAYPEILFWRWKARTQRSATDLETVEKYVALCQSSSAKLRRKHRNDPWLCQKLPEAEAFVREARKNDEA